MPRPLTIVLQCCAPWHSTCAPGLPLCLVGPCPRPAHYPTHGRCCKHFTDHGLNSRAEVLQLLVRLVGESGQEEPALEALADLLRQQQQEEALALAKQLLQGRLPLLIRRLPDEPCLLQVWHGVTW